MNNASWIEIQDDCLRIFKALVEQLIGKRDEKTNKLKEANKFIESAYYSSLRSNPREGFAMIARKKTKEGLSENFEIFLVNPSTMKKVVKNTGIEKTTLEAIKKLFIEQNCLEEGIFVADKVNILYLGIVPVEPKFLSIEEARTAVAEAKEKLAAL